MGVQWGWAGSKGSMQTDWKFSAGIAVYVDALYRKSANKSFPTHTHFLFAFASYDFSEFKWKSGKPESIYLY